MSSEIIFGLIIGALIISNYFERREYLETIRGMTAMMKSANPFEYHTYMKKPETPEEEIKLPDGMERL